MVTYSVNQKTYPTNRFLPVNNSVLVQPTEFLPPQTFIRGVFYHTVDYGNFVPMCLDGHLGISVSETKYFALCALGQLQTLIQNV